LCGPLQESAGPHPCVQWVHIIGENWRYIGQKLFTVATELRALFLLPLKARCTSRETASIYVILYQQVCAFVFVNFSPESISAAISRGKKRRIWSSKPQLQPCSFAPFLIQEEMHTMGFHPCCNGRPIPRPLILLLEAAEWRWKSYRGRLWCQEWLDRVEVVERQVLVVDPPIHRNKPTISCSQPSFSGSRTVQIHAPSVAMAPWKAEGLTCRILEKNAKKYVNLVGVSTR